MAAALDCEGRSWSSSGLGRGEAIARWRDWASRTLAPIDVRVSPGRPFAARWASRPLGGLQFVRMGATAQRVVHPQDVTGPTQHAPTFQLV